jgi:hypothetical protein
MRIRWNNRFYDVQRTAPVIQHELVRRASRIAAACGEGYAADLDASGRVSARSSVYTRTYQARRDNARNNTILRNLDAGRF